MVRLWRVILPCLLMAVAGQATAVVTVRDTVAVARDTMRVKLDGVPGERSIEVRAATGDKTGRGGWSAMLAGNDGMGRLRARVAFGNINDDPFFKPYLRLSVDTLGAADGWREVLSADYTDHVELYGGANSITFRQHDGRISVGAGGDRLMQGITVEWPHCVYEVSVVSDRRLTVNHVAVSTRPDRRVPLMTAWTADSLDAYLAAAQDRMEGYWRYLDRDIDARWSRLGGFYRLAVVRNASGGYDMLYLDGAENHRGLWRPMMIKGIMTPTRFDRHYDLEWKTARLESAGPECSADLSDELILTLNLPLHHAVIRFARE